MGKELNKDSNCEYENQDRYNEIENIIIQAVKIASGKGSVIQ